MSLKHKYALDLQKVVHLFCRGVCHNFSIKVKNEGTGASKTLSKYAKDTNKVI